VPVDLLLFRSFYLETQAGWLLPPADLSEVQRSIDHFSMASPTLPRRTAGGNAPFRDWQNDFVHIGKRPDVTFEGDPD
jgi:hypothetical protein